MSRWPLASSLAAAAGALLLACAAMVEPRLAAQDQVAFDSTRAYDHLRQLVGFGPRPAASPANARTRAYLIAELGKIGITASEQALVADTPVGKVKMANVLATIPGQRRERIGIASHFDTKPIDEFRFVGANDGGSSTAALLELARVLKARKTLPFSIELLFFDGEEAYGEWRDLNHTFGSRHYVAAARTAGTLSSLRALILLDMIGERGLQIRRDTNSSPWLQDIIWAQAKKMGHGGVFLDEPYPVEDDHIPFLRAGVPAVDLIDLDYPDWHQAGDTLDKVGARSLQIVGDVVVAALPLIEQRLGAK